MVKGRMMVGESFNFTPAHDEIIEKGDVLVLIGREEDFDRFSNSD